MSQSSKVVLITGATSGIGAELAIQYTSLGHKVALIGRRTQKLSEVSEQCKKANADAETLSIEADVCYREQIDNAVSKTLETWGRLDIFIANAGFAVSGTVNKLDRKEYERQFDTNVYGVISSAKSSFKALKESKGQFVVVGSVMSHITVPRMSAYSMSKYAVRALAEALYFEWRKHGIAVTLLCPGYVESEIHKISNEGVFDEKIEDKRPRQLVVPVDKACRQMIRAIDSRVPEKAITGHGAVMIWLKRHFPWLVRQTIGKFY